MKDDKLTMLMILDGFGDNKNKDGNAIKLAKTPNIDRIMRVTQIQIYIQVVYKLDYQKDKWEIQK